MLTAKRNILLNVKSDNSLAKTGNRNYLIAACLLFIVFAIYYYLILYFRIGTDVQIHAGMAFSFFRGDDNITPNFLYYFLVGLLAGFSKYKMAYYISSVILLSAAIAFKFLVNVFYVKKFTALDTFTTTVMAIMMLFIFSLPGVDFFENKSFYFGQLAPNVWHNSTVIFLAPFGIILFFETIIFFHTKNISITHQVFIFLLILVNAVIKPSFLFTIIPVVFLFSLSHFKAKFKQSLKYLLPYLAGVFLIALEYFFIYKLNSHQSVLSSKEVSSVIVSPFEMWNHFSTNIPVAFITSCLFPIVYTLYTKGSVLKDQLVSFAGINFLFAILIWILFIETGFRRYHGNFYWQVVIANYLLFFTMLIHLLKQMNNTTNNIFVKKILLSLFGLHFIWGIVYWASIIFSHRYN